MSFDDGCYVCGKSAMLSKIRAIGVTFHPKCFICSICSCDLTGDDINFKADDAKKLYCVNDYAQKYSPRCTDCGNPIVPEAGESGVSRLVVNGADYHPACYKAKGNGDCRVCGKEIASGGKISAVGCVFHAKCFACIDCGQDLSADDAVFKVDDDKNLYCSHHYNL